MILTLDIAGNPSRWMTHQDIIRLASTDRILAMIGENKFEYLGGINAKTLIRSSVTVSSIVYTKHQVKGHLYDKGYEPPLTNESLFFRDQHTCMYDGNQHPVQNLTRDHIIPRSKGGKDTWTNVATCCRKCNNEKADKTPEEWGHRLIAVPYAPNYAEYLIMLNRRILIDQMDFLLGRVSSESRLRS